MIKLYYVEFVDDIWMLLPDGRAFWVDGMTRSFLEEGAIARNAAAIYLGAI